MRSIPPSSSATRATTATAFATTWRSEASNPSSRRDRTVRRQSNTIGKPTSGATSSSDASIASSNSGASPPDTRKPPELTFRCYASQQRNSGSKPSTRPSPKRFAARLVVKKVAPVTLSGGRLSLVTKPDVIGSPPFANTTGIAVVADLAASAAGGQCRQSIVLAIRPAVYDRYIVALDIANFAQTVAERSHERSFGVRRPGAEETNYRHWRLLRLCGERPCHRAGQTRNEFPPTHDHLVARIGTSAHGPSPGADAGCWA